MNTPGESLLCLRCSTQSCVNRLSPRVLSLSAEHTRKIVLINNIHNRDAIFHVFLDNGSTFCKSPIGELVQFSKSFGFLYMIHPAKFCSGSGHGDLWGYVRKVAWRLSTVTELVSVCVCVCSL